MPGETFFTSCDRDMRSCDDKDGVRAVHLLPKAFRSNGLGDTKVESPLSSLEQPRELHHNCE